MLPFARVSIRAIRNKSTTVHSQFRTLNFKKNINNNHTQKTFDQTTWNTQYFTQQFHSTRANWDDHGSNKKNEHEEEKKSNQQERKTEKNDKKDVSDKKKNDSNDDDRQFWTRLGFTTAGSLLLLTLLNYWVDSVPSGNQIDWYTFKTKFLSTGKVEKVVVYSNTNQVMVIVKDQHAPGGTKQYFFTIGDVNTFEKHMNETQQMLGIHPNDYIPILYTKHFAHDAINFGWSVIPLIATIVITVMVFKRVSGPIGGAGGAGGVFSFGKSTAKKYSKQTKVPITFKQVAGMAETKQEVMEFVDFLKSPAKYKKLGAKTPKGALLVGPPGTGKTLLAKATAGEAGVPFYSISGSEFVEMFVGVGSARVRDLFEEARADAPCIIFIDEIDAIGRARSKSSFANDERENTLNQLLVEMDGFNTESGVVVLAGTNRPDILDNALLRPGRFDRQIYIDNPDIKGRKEIFEVHLKPLKLEKSIGDYAKPLAALTPGFSGADIANVCNEGALIAARNNKTSVDMKDLEAAIERVIGGMERKNRVLSPDEKKTVAYHEAGHATVGWFLEHASPLLKVSIVPRGIAALGYAMYQPKDQHMYSREQLIDMMCVSLGGRIAEWLIFGRITTGASDDLDKVTKMAYSQVMQLGMSSSLGPVSFQQPKEGEIVLEKPYSEATARLIDKEVRVLVDTAYQKTEQILTEKRDLLERLAQVLLEKEVIKREDMVSILGPRPWGEETTYEQITGETST